MILEENWVVSRSYLDGNPITVEPPPVFPREALFYLFFQVLQVLSVDHILLVVGDEQRGDR